MNPEAIPDGFTPLPLEQWRSDMIAAVNDIRSLGMELLQAHRSAGDKAAETAQHWQLEERQEEEHAALMRLIDAGEAIARRLDDVLRDMQTDTLTAATAAIDAHLPDIESAFLTVRQAAQDLLRWTRRAGRLEGSTLPDAYRAAYGRLIAYAPTFKPRLEALQQTLLKRVDESSGKTEGMELLLSAITRYNGVMDTARRFVRAIVDPPLELVFQETRRFLEDWESIPAEMRGRLASELNDCCQFLLYDEVEFERRAEAQKPRLADGMEASLYKLPVESYQLLFTVDEDPLFGQLTVTLLRAVECGLYEETLDSTVHALYSDFTQGGSHG